MHGVIEKIRGGGERPLRVSDSRYTDQAPRIMDDAEGALRRRDALVSALGEDRAAT
jgi:hypothetical protein